MGRFGRRRGGGIVTARDSQKELERTQRAQREAADPLSSAWVSANAGTGKTHVLTQRTLRLMLSGTEPERILCLTYTKAAAAEMSKRVFDTLAGWVTLPVDELREALTKLTAHPPSGEEIDCARTLFTAAIETPGGLKVQTIHSFCERLLQRFPLEAGVAPGFTILDEATAHLLQRESIDAVLHFAAAHRDAPEGRALETAVRYAADDRFDDLLRSAMRERQWLEEATRINIGEDDDEFAAVERLYRSALDVRDDITGDDLEGELAGLVEDAQLIRLRDALLRGGSNDVKNADKITLALGATSDSARVEALEDYFCTSTGETRSSLMAKAIKTEHPDLNDTMSAAQGRFIALLDERKALLVIDATIALHRLASSVLQRYINAKAQRAALDYDDLIAKTAKLLGNRQSAAWVLYKLDRGIDHILVDEAQDTSREQWQVVEALAEEFFTGAGQREEMRTLFAVGDEKQSIYSFQGAQPKMFAEMGDKFAAATKAAQQPWRRIGLNLSFRTVASILTAVDRVFCDHKRTPGLTAREAAIQHAVHRVGHAGLVEIWPTEKPEDNAGADVWSPLDDEASRSAEVRLAERIAQTIKGWLDSEELLHSENRPIRPGDILILLRKRRPFAGPMVAALKSRGIPVAGADRLRMSEQIAVADLVSLGDFLMLPEDDLALAEILKSPLFGFDDDDLMALAPGRKGTLWSALIANADAKPHFKAATETLKRWRSRADFIPPFEFFASILDREGARAKFLARLGPEAADPLDEFLNLALSYDDAAAPSLTGFLAFLRETEREVKRDMEHGRNEVRVMTVHGAKGLEAPIVFLPDTCTSAAASSAGTALLELADMKLPQGVKATPFVWSVKGTSKLKTISAARNLQKAIDAEERHRLLYVAMTRARDRLYVAGFEGKKGRASGCWYDLIDEALRPSLQETEGPGGTKVLRWSERQSAAPVPPKHALTDDSIAEPLPPWATRPAPREPNLTIPLAPSRLEAYAPDDESEPLPTQQGAHDADEPAIPSPTSFTSEHRFLRGTLTHALLEHLPTLPQAGREKAAREFIAIRGAELSASVRSNIVEETLAILNAPEFAALFGPHSRAEVPIVALIANPKSKEPPLRLIGQIDRLVDLGDEVLIVDYKTNRPPPTTVEGVAPAYLFQLAAYSLALGAIYPGRTVRTALLWTEVPRIMQIPAEVLDTYCSRLWDLNLSHLDANEAHS
ncbi:MAG: double-strand break repair helicase AddA [Hyphomicrobium sp.]